MKNHLPKELIRGVIRMSRFFLLIVFLQTLTASLLIAAESRAQGKSIYEININLNLKDAELIDVFRRIESETGFSFSYHSEIVDESERISVSGKSSFGELLEKISKQTDLKFRRVDDNIHVYKKSKGEDPVEEDHSAMQGYKVTGQVTDDNGEGLPGATVLEKGTTNGTTTDVNGKFNLQVTGQNATLVFSFIGYQTQEIAVGNQTEFNIALLPDIQSLNEVVVIGYTSAKKEELASSVGSLSSGEITGMATTDVRQAIQGKMAGVQVVNNGGAPGSGARIIVRGVGSFSNPDPLYVIDGIMGGDINSVLPQDIESITVLKDAATTAIYGSGGANGVVIINTKSGKRDKMTISYEGSTGFSEVTERYDMLNASDYVDVVADIQAAGGLDLSEKLMSAEVRQDRTDWQDVVFRRGAFHQHSLNLSGGAENINFSVSGGYTKEESTVIARDFQRANLSAKLNETFGRFRFTQNLRVKYDKNDGVMANFNDVLRMPPYLGIYDPDNLGGYSRADKTTDLQDANNPYNSVYNSDYQSRDLNLNLDLSGSVEILDYLSFNSQARLSGGNYSDYTFNRPSNGGNFVRSVPDMSETLSRYYSYIIENFLSFDNAYGDHSVSAVVGNTYSGPTIYRRVSLAGSDFTNDRIQNIGLAGTKSITASDVNSGKALISYFGRVSYSFQNKYILNASIRRDASSVFGENFQAGVFPGVGLAWNISEESFLSAVPAISNLMLRTSYGKTGNDHIPGFLTTTNVWRGWSNNIVYSFGDDGTFSPGSTVNTLPNPNLKWEETTQIDVGLDLGLFNNQLNLVLDYYVRNNEDLLIQTIIPASTGLGEPGGAARQWINAAAMENKGFEMALSYGGKAGDFTYNISLNGTHNKNEVTALGTAGNTPLNDGVFAGAGNSTRTDIGHPLASFYGYVVDHVAVDQQDVDRLNEGAANASNGEVTEYAPGLAPGDFVFKDLDGNGFIDSEDRTFLGNPSPEWQYGGMINLGYKGFDLGLNIMGLAGVDVVNGSRYWLEGMSKPFNQTTNTLRRWKKEGDVTDMPAAGQNSGRNLEFSSWYVESGDYLRVKNFTLGYTLPAGLLTSFTGNVVKSFRIYTAIQNALTFTNYSGYDPEIGAMGTANSDFIFRRGIDNNQLPNPRTYRLGLQLSF